jgi:peptide chain release factor subunit 1
MAELDSNVLRNLAGWNPDGVPVSSLYLDIDGRRLPRPLDLQQRATEVAHGLKDQAAGLDRAGRKAVACDAAAMLEYLEQEFERGSARGLALFSSGGNGLWAEVRTSRPMSDRAVVGARPYVLPLEALLETQRSFCAVLVDRSRARVLLARSGGIREHANLTDVVPRRHEQGGRAQARYQRHVEDHVGRHLRRVGAEVRRVDRAPGFDHLILGGPSETLAEFERVLSDAIRRRIAERTSLPTTTPMADVLQRIVSLEERLESEKESLMLDRIRASTPAGAAVTGVRDTLRALNAGRVGTLVVPLGAAEPGVRCVSCGYLGVGGGPCPRCRSRMEAVPDVLDAAVAAALQHRVGVETLSMQGAGEPIVGALLRF